MEIRNTQIELLSKLLSTFFEKLTVGRDQQSINYRLINKMLIQLIALHKLECRIDKDYFKKNNFENLDYVFFNDLESIRNKTRMKFEKQVLVLRELSDSFKLRGYNELPIVIKGASIYGITGDLRTIKRSNDIDIIYSDFILLESVLTEMGFEKDEMNETSKHEHSLMVRGDILIDIHKYIPILKYSESIINKAMKAKRTESTILFESFTKMEEYSVDYVELGRHSFSDYSNLGLRVPAINYQVLILCAEIFRDYVNSQSHFSSGIIIADLLDVMELIRHPTFQMSQFITITNGERRLSVSFVAHLLKELFNNYLLESFIDEQICYPKFLFWNGTMYLPTDSHEYIYSDPSDITRLLRSETFNLFENKRTIIPNKFNYNSHGISNVKLVHLEKDNGLLNIKITLLNKPITNTTDVFEITIEGKRCCVSLDENCFIIEELVRGCKVELYDEKEEYSVVLSVPINMLLPPLKINSGIIICVTRWGDGPLSTVIPLTVLNSIS
ncbi:hypothetical protein ACFVQB_12110 [Paenibacillus sp. NPDC057886]|uniref:hypothetical protein n=1 Tax=Paenibacillus sp. NPDC057886 TaxID=3346270 RepID=UPI0036BE623B